MATVPPIMSTALLMVGVVLVFFGFSTALGFSVSGIVASVAAIGALLYAGAVWFGSSAVGRSGGSAAAPLVVFDLERRIVTGPQKGQPVSSLFPEMVRREIDQRSIAALAGTSARFACFYDGQAILLDALPVRSADGTIVYGILLTNESVPASVSASA